MAIEEKLSTKDMYKPIALQDKQCRFSCDYSPDQDRALSVSLSSGFTLLVPLHEGQQVIDDKLRLAEQDVIIKKPDGTLQMVYTAGGWGEPNDLVIDTKNGHVIIDQLLTLSEGGHIKEYRAHTLSLKCSRGECGFFWQNTCMLNFDKYDGPQFHSDDTRQLKRDLTDVIIFQGLEGLLKVALSGNKHAYDMFFDQDNLDKYFHFDGYIGEIYNIYREFLEDYFERCPSKLTK